MAGVSQAEANDQVEVVRWYTRARRFPKLIGKTPGGEKIWGGPYTLMQFIVGASAFFISVKTKDLWGHFGTLGDIALAVGVSIGLAVLAGKATFGSRNPLSVATGALRALSAPAYGRVGGVPVRERRRESTVRSRVAIAAEAPEWDDVRSDGLGDVGLVSSGAAPAVEAGASASATPVMTNVQWLLARGSGGEEKG